jgi:hypothetical protein
VDIAPQSIFDTDNGFTGMVAWIVQTHATMTETHMIILT